MSAKVLSIYNKKGGVGKTTTAIVISSILASNHNKKVILIDMDMQGDMSTGMMIPESNPNNTIWNSLFESDKLLADKIHDNFIVVNGDHRMTNTAFQREVQGMKGARLGNLNAPLSRLLNRYREHCDLIVLDCPPSADIIVHNALFASDYVLIPTKPHKFDINGVYNAMELIEEFRVENHNIKLLGVLFTQYDSRSNLHQVQKERISDDQEARVFNTHIRQNTKLQEMTTLNKDVNEFMKQLKEDKTAFLGYEDYTALVEEIVERINL
jgi:chromosome partitioning protein